MKAIVGSPMSQHGTINPYQECTVTTIYYSLEKSNPIVECHK